MDGKNSEVLVGRVAGPFGVKGWVKVASFTQPPANILQYRPWQLRNAGNGTVDRVVDAPEGKVHGKGLVVRFDGISDRDAAETLKGLQITIARDCLPEPSDGSYYWADLEGMQVVTQEGQILGRIDHMLEAGAADVMVVCGDGGDKDRHLIPFLRDEVILKVDLAERVVVVNWNTDQGG